MSKYSKKAQKAISAKMHKMKDEDKSQSQKVAIAISEAREKGLKVPDKKNSGADIHCSSHNHLSNQNLRGSNKSLSVKKWNK